MRAVQAQVREWGRSLGVIIPRETVVDEHIKAGDTLNLLIGRDEDVVSTMFGKAKMKRSTDEILKEIDEEAWNE